MIMATLTEDYVSFETAKLLKEKGMNESCFKHYVQKNNNDGTSEAVTVCTLQMAMKWLREVHNIVISIFPTIETDMIVREDYNYAIYKNKTVVYQSCSTSYEQAIEAAIKYCLENLI